MLASCERVEHEVFAGRILPFDERAAHRFAQLCALKRSLGQGIAVMDAMIAAIAIAHAMTLATRNVRDFEGLGVPLVDPFTA
ncbi:MAG: PIN domain-containing protein [Methylocystis sp.]